MRKKYLTLFTAILLVLMTRFPVWAQYNPPPGSSGLYELYSPTFLAGGVSSVSESSPAGDVLNPAASGAKQRLTLDFSYLSLLGPSAEQGLGHIINAGITVPTRAGVFSASGRFITSPFSSLNLGTFGALNVSFAKDLFPNLLVGAGLGGQFGTDWGLGLDLGFIHLAGDLGLLKDFRWGVAVRGLGKGSAPVAGYTPIPAPFTPAVGLHFGLLDSEAFKLGFGADLAFPSFQNVRASLGTEISIMDFLFIQASGLFDLKEWTGRTARSLPVSFGVAVKFATSGGKDRSEVKTTLSAAPLQGGIWALGAGANMPIGRIDRNPPLIELGPSEDYISPNLDGTLDDLIQPLSISDDRFIKGFRLLVTDSLGNKVREIVNKDERPENLTVQNIIDRLAYVKTGIPIPEQLRWDGRSDQGAVVPDGTYTYRVEAWDDNGNLGSSETITVVVDNTPPQVEIKASYLIFSPNDDGNKDVLPIEQSGSEEILWQGSIQNADGDEVALFQWENSAPAPLPWDGKNKEGILVPDGVYSFRIASRDRAGNSGSARLDNIIVNTQTTPINISINESFFSPNGDSVKDELVFSLEVPVTSGIERWSLTVADEQGKGRRTFSGSVGIEPSISFDGKDEGGSPLPEGRYKGVLEVLYANGNNPTASSPELTIDLTPPVASVSGDFAIFSPDGDGIKDEVTVFQETSSEQLWEGNIEDREGRPVRRFSWRGRAEARISWAGREDEGRLLPDGVYYYSLKSIDRAGNFGQSKKIQFELNTEKTEVFLSTNLSDFSPNADGVKDRIILTPTLKMTAGVKSYELRILDGAGRTVRKIKGQNRAPEATAWDGLDDNGRRLPDGNYLVELELDYLKGDHHEVRATPFNLDTTAPEIKVSADFFLFSPDEDGYLDSIPIAQSSSREDLWEGEILKPKGEVVRGFFWKGEASRFEWNGKDENGNKIPDGLYNYRIRGTDRAGNSASAVLKGLEIDTRQTPAFITVSKDGFSPNGDGFIDEISFNAYVGLEEGLKSWKLEMVHKERGVQKAFRGAGSVPGSLTWEGSSDIAPATARAPEGEYRARFSLEYVKGNRPEVLSTPFRLDVSPPLVDLILSPQPFSPDNDGVDDELYLAIKVRDSSPVSNWNMLIDDPTGNRFTGFRGKGNPSERIIWDGLSDTGELVQAAEDYNLIFTVTDELGNEVTLKSIIPVDVLVFRDGDKLKIRIASITFPANSPDLSAVDDVEKAAKNARTIKRLLEIFTKYSTYKIRIEGHANIILGTKEEATFLDTLSSGRAEAVKQALVELGLQPGRISTTGLGGTQPIVPFSDTENRWKNRRVEFILLKL